MCVISVRNAGFPRESFDRRLGSAALDELEHLGDGLLMLTLVLDRELPGVAVGQNRLLRREVGFIEGTQDARSGARQIVRQAGAVGDVDPVVLRVVVGVRKDEGQLVVEQGAAHRLTHRPKLLRPSHVAEMPPRWGCRTHGREPSETRRERDPKARASASVPHRGLGESGPCGRSSSPFPPYASPRGQSRFSTNQPRPSVQVRFDGEAGGGAKGGEALTRVLLAPLGHDGLAIRELERGVERIHPNLLGSPG